MARVSIVIPCYNQGKYVGDALDSVRAQTFTDIETIIVDDGSDDTSTRELLSRVPDSIATVARTPNRGLAAARNAGIERASGEFLLPLDADDMISPTCVEDSLAAIEHDRTVGIVYGEAIKFGAQRERWELPPFSLQQMTLNNCIYCTALYRRADWERAGGYNPNMRGAWEDWDFWLALIELGCEVHKLDTVTFYYRVRKRSMVSSLTAEKKARLHYQLLLNHPEFFRSNMLPLFQHFYEIKRGSLSWRWRQRLMGRTVDP